MIRFLHETHLYCHHNKPHRIFCLLLLLTFMQFGFSHIAEAQCGYAAGLGCSSTDYNNFGYNANNDPATIEYDNYVSAYHQTVARTFSGDFQIWGHFTASDGSGSVLSPQSINATNYPGLTGTILKASIGSNGYSHQQTIILATTGLFAMGSPGTVLSTDIINQRPFTKLTVDGRSNGLPPGVAPADVKMLVATYQTLALLTCTGEVWVLSQTAAMRGNGSEGNARTWHRTRTSTAGSTPLDQVIAIRASTAAMMALKTDGTLWTWGIQAYRGDGSAPELWTIATEMTRPKSGTIKMIGVTSDKKFASFYVLYTDGWLYSLGNNAKRQLGDWTTTERRSWTRPRYQSASGPQMNDIRWISAMEHDWKYPALNAINEGMSLFNWGAEQGHSLGRGNMSETPVDPGMPLGLGHSDQILSVEAGGHTTMFTEKCQENFGYVGHRVHGSMGNGSLENTYESQINYNTAYVPICGAMNTPVIGAFVINATGDVCQGATILLDPQPMGGSLAIVSGAGTIHGNELTFNAQGEVVVSYTVASDCGMKTIMRSFEVTGCILFKVRGTVWIDSNEDAIRDPGESGTNAGTQLTNGVWANLIDAQGYVIQSVPVNLNGSYELHTSVAGNYSVVVTNQQIGAGSMVMASSRILPGSWRYTGNNAGTPCVVPACTDPDIIPDIALHAGRTEVFGLDFGIIGPEVLLVHLGSFKAKKKGSSAVISWTTHAEERNQGFSVQRSEDGIKWYTIDFVPTAAPGGSSNTLIAYTFVDHRPASGTNFYRLKLTDQEGRFLYSIATTVHFAEQQATVSVYPNPVVDFVAISGLTGNETISILDYTGRTMYRRVAGGHKLTVDLSALPAGYYQVIAEQTNGSRQVVRLFKRAL